MQKMDVPTESELAGKKPYCLDTEWMLNNFLGKTKEEAIELFKNHSVAEDFSYMSHIGLNYYLEAALEYLRSDAVANEDWDFPSFLLCSLHCQVTIWNIDASVIPLIKEVADYCSNNTEKLDLDKDCELFQSYINSIKMA